MNLQLSINQIFKLISTNGADKTYIIEGGIGTGKSSIAKLFNTDHYNVVIIDCTQFDVGDVQMPSIDRERRLFEFLPNSLLMGDGAKPMVIMLDEIGKAARPVQNTLAPVMLEHRVGAVPLPAGSIVFGTTNLSAEGVGDLFQAHTCNRVSFIEMRSPTAEEWVDWALRNNVNEAMLAWCSEEGPRLFGSFRDHKNPADFPYGFHPAEKRRSFVTPRSLYLASVELIEERRATINDPDVTLAALAGNLGPRAALDLMAFVHLADKLPAWDLVVNQPTKAPVPDNAAAVMMTVFKAVRRATADTLDNLLVYIQRLPKETQCVFVSQLLRSGKPWAALNGSLNQLVRTNHWLLK